jgi:hypothetical protein
MYNKFWKELTNPVLMSVVVSMLITVIPLKMETETFAEIVDNYEHSTCPRKLKLYILYNSTPSQQKVVNRINCYQMLVDLYALNLIRLPSYEKSVGIP